MPDRWLRKFSAVRSAVRIDASGPVDTTDGRAGGDVVTVVGGPLDDHRRVELRERLGGAARPGQHAGAAGHEVGGRDRARVERARR